jgi:hypothetical protein
MIITKAKELNNQNKELAACVTNIEVPKHYNVGPFEGTGQNAD